MNKQQVVANDLKKCSRNLTAKVQRETSVTPALLRHAAALLEECSASHVTSEQYEALRAECVGKHVNLDISVQTVDTLASAVTRLLVVARAAIDLFPFLDTQLAGKKVETMRVALASLSTPMPCTWCKLGEDVCPLHPLTGNEKPVQSIDAPITTGQAVALRDDDIRSARRPGVAPKPGQECAYCVDLATHASPMCANHAYPSSVPWPSAADAA